MRRATGGISLVVGVLMGGLVGFPVAVAATDWSDLRDFTSNGAVQYSNTSGISNSSSWDYKTTIYRFSHGNAQPGKMGARVRAYWSDGTLCQYTSTHYNQVATQHFTVTVSNGQCGGYVYSRGYSETWDGDGFEVLATNRTGNLLY